MAKGTDRISGEQQGEGKKEDGARVRTTKTSSLDSCTAQQISINRGPTKCLPLS